MKNLARSLTLVVVACTSEIGQEQERATAPSTFDQTHAVWTEVLAAHVSGGAFDYATLKKEPARLDAYLATLHAVTPDALASWTKSQRYAFWINAYNAHTIRKVLDNYPLKSIRDLDGLFGLSSVFDDAFIAMPALHPKGKNEKLSLNDIEHGILRADFQDARVHAAVNCASISCPNLRAEAFVAAKLDAQLDEQMRLFIADPTKNRFNEKKSRVSEIFKWFKDDFERDAKSVREYVARYASNANAQLVRDAKLEYLSYDWKLNDVAQ